MLGTFQQSHLRIEVRASEATIRESLTHGECLRRWLAPQSLTLTDAEVLTSGQTFTSWLGPVAIDHQVLRMDDQTLQFQLSRGVDGVHEWHWGDGWVQSRIAGVSLLPINLGQTASLLRLRLFVESLDAERRATTGSAPS
jgi:hypothetical protein